jgi:hypothetical protein
MPVGKFVNCEDCSPANSKPWVLRFRTLHIRRHSEPGREVLLHCQWQRCCSAPLALVVAVGGRGLRLSEACWVPAWDSADSKLRLRAALAVD